MPQTRDRIRLLAGGSRRTWPYRAEIPIVLFVVTAVIALVARGTTLVVLIGVLQALLLAVAVRIWQRQSASLRKERQAERSQADVQKGLTDVQRRLKKISRELGGRAVGGVEGSHRSVHGQLRLLDSRTAGVTHRLDRHAQKVAQHTDDELAAITRSDRRRQSERVQDFAQVEAMVNLYAQLSPVARMPGLRGWALSPDLLLVIVELIRQRRPRTFVELGSGSSTLWLAHAMRALGQDGRIISIEHDEHWATKVHQLLESQNLQKYVDVRLAPLANHRIGDKEWSWYNSAGWNDLSEIDMLLVDGPPAATGPSARFPAIPLIADRLSGDAVVIMDDGVRKDEQEIAEAWAPLLEGFNRLDPPSEKKAILFYRGAALAI